MEVLVDVAGRSQRIGKRDVATAILKLGFVHIRSINRTAIITLAPRLVQPVTLAATAYKVADLDPERTIVVATAENEQCWAFSGYMLAIGKMMSLVGGAFAAGAGAKTKYLL